MATTTNFGWETPDDTDLVKDGALAIRTLGSAIDTSLVDLKGGTTGQVLSKTSNTDMDFTWVTSDDANAIQNAIVDAKGDLIAASAADTPARLAVGNNGETLVADSSQTTGLRYNPQNALANPVINGGFDMWQRSTSSAIGTAATFVADRWRGYRSSFVAGMTVSRQSVSDSTNLPNIQYCLRGQRDSGNTNTNGYSIYTNLETTNSIPFAGKAITLSFYARAGANYSPSSSALNVYLFTGTGTDQDYLSSYTGSVTAIGSTATLTTTWQRFAFTATLATNMTEMAIRIGADASVGTAGAADYFEVTGVQIDLGTYTASSAPTFRRAGGNIAGEFSACQRYYERFDSSADGWLFLYAGYANSTTSARGTIPLQVTKRVSPTVTVTNAGSLVARDGSVNATATAFTIGRPQRMLLGEATLTTTGLTLGRGLMVDTSGNTNFVLEASAEL